MQVAANCFLFLFFHNYSKTLTDTQQSVVRPERLIHQIKLSRITIKCDDSQREREKEKEKEKEIGRERERKRENLLGNSVHIMGCIPP